MPYGELSLAILMLSHFFCFSSDVGRNRSAAHLVIFLNLITCRQFLSLFQLLLLVYRRAVQFFFWQRRRRIETLSRRGNGLGGPSGAKGRRVTRIVLLQPTHHVVPAPVISDIDVRSGSLLRRRPEQGRPHPLTRGPARYGASDRVLSKLRIGAHTRKRRRMKSLLRLVRHP